MYFGVVYQRAFNRVKGRLNLFVRSGVIEGIFTTVENENEYE